MRRVPSVDLSTVSPADIQTPEMIHARTKRPAPTRRRPVRSTLYLPDTRRHAPPARSVPPVVVVVDTARVSQVRCRTFRTVLHAVCRFNPHESFLGACRLQSVIDRSETERRRTRADRVHACLCRLRRVWLPTACLLRPDHALFRPRPAGLSSTRSRSMATSLRAQQHTDNVAGALAAPPRRNHNSARVVAGSYSRWCGGYDDAVPGPGR